MASWLDKGKGYCVVSYHMASNWAIYYTLKKNILRMRNVLFGINKRGYLWEQHKFTLERGTNNKYIEFVFCVLKNFPWDKIHSNLTVSLHWLNCISSLMFVLMFIGDILDIDRDEELTHSLSQRCTRTSNEMRMPNTTHTSSEMPLNVRSLRCYDTPRDSSVLYQDTSMCLKFMHMQKFAYSCIFIFVLNLVHWFY